MLSLCPRSLRVRLLLRCAAPLLLAVPSHATPTLSFADVSVAAGIVRTGASYGAAWGDVNGDGFPDLWVGNHGTPALYENRGDGTFRVGTSRIQGLVNRDCHGPAWADFDNDGDQDLLQVVGGANPNLLYVNNGGLLTNQATQFGVGLPGARSRTPLWVDFDLDGWLDLILTQEAGGAFPPVAMRNTGAGFQDVSDAVGFSLASSSLAMLGNLTGSTPPEILVEDSLLLHFPAFVFETASSSSFVNVTSQLGFAPGGASAANDGVVADFTGDLRNDLFVVKRSTNSQLAQVGSNELRARMNAAANEKAFTFDSAGPITIELFPNFTATANMIRIGAAGVSPSSLTLQLDPADPAVDGVATHVAGTDLGIFVGRLPTSGSWWVSLSSPTSLGLDVRVRSVAPITGATPIGFPADPPGARPNFYVASGTSFVERRSQAGLDALRDCLSAVAGDFDNDMDLDLYLLCTDPVVNTPNLLFENLGAGTFTQVAGAAGAAGATSGRGESVVVADYDRDGFLDLFVANGLEGVPFNAGPLQLFRNQGNVNHWLEIDLDGTRSNRDAVGARVTVSAGGVNQLREQNGGVHRAAQNHQRVHFGLGSNSMVDRIEVVWPNGGVSVYGGVSADQVLTLTERVSASPPACGLGGELIPLFLALESWRRARARRQRSPVRLRSDA